MVVPEIAILTAPTAKADTVTLRDGVDGLEVGEPKKQVSQRTLRGRAGDKSLFQAADLVRVRFAIPSRVVITGSKTLRCSMSITILDPISGQLVTVPVSKPRPRSE
ncbi:hypothetical protein [Methylobacterium nigriterrae]|uniref:hypothetical protein n=1 Tax=Methylobacterium nigriterrae TaxID=3127512 RepID=UPI0030133E30